MGKNIIKFLDKQQEDLYFSTKPISTDHVVFKTDMDDGYFVGYDENKLTLRQIPLTFKMNGNGQVTWKYTEYNSASFYKTIQYRINGGGWTSITATTEGVSFSVSNGDIVQFRGDNVAYGKSSGSYTPYNCLSASANHDVYGNVMSLINSTNFENITTHNQSYFLAYLFSGDTKLINAKDLILPVTTLADGAYLGMFHTCTGLKTAPKLPATDLGYGCYTWMFMNCTSLTDVPEIRATNTSNNSFSYMFDTCRALTNFTYLGPAGVKGMYIFDTCPNLNYLRILGPQNSTSYWTGGVASTGTFIKCVGDTWTTGTSGIPTNWTVYAEISKDCNVQKVYNFLNTTSTISVKDVGACTITHTTSNYNHQFDIIKDSDNSLVASFKINSWTYKWNETPSETVLIETTA